MKKLFTVFTIASVLFVACGKDDSTTPANNNPPPDQGLTVKKKNHAAVIYFGEDWCPPCGSYGGPTLDSLIAKEEGDLLTGIKINSQSNNSSLNWAPGNPMFGEFDQGVFGNASAIPSMAVNNVKQPVYIQINTNVTQAIAKATTFSTSPVIAGIALSKSITGNKMKVETKIKFYEAEAAGNDYRLTIFVVEDHVVANQSLSSGSPDPNYVHRNMVRTANASIYTGVSVNNSAAITVNKEFSKTYTIDLQSTWNHSKLKAVAILWKMGTIPATVINSNVAK